MEVVKRNMYSIVSGAVALLAVLLAWYPFSGWFEQLGTKLKESKALYQTLNQLVSTEHYLPKLKLDDEEQASLGHFPNPKNIEEGKALVKQLQDQSQKLTDIVLGWNKREPLVPGLFPDGPDSVMRSSFKFNYYKALKDFKDALKATNPPTNAEVKAEMDKIRKQMLETQLVTIGGQDNRSEIDKRLNEKQATLPEEMCLQRARDFNMYVTTRAIDTCGREGYMPALTDNAVPDMESIWAAQVCLWIEADVVRAIIETNKEMTGPGVEHAIVKRLRNLTVPKKYMTSKGEITFVTPRYLGGGDPRGAAWQQPFTPTAAAAPVDMAEPDSPSTRIYVASATGRVCNSLYDVIHFTVVADCDAMNFRKFMSNLVKDRFITILRTDFTGVDRDKEMSNGFLYGSSPVVRVAMRCEAIFFRQWETKLMPPSVRKALKIPDDAPPAAQ